MSRSVWKSFSKKGAFINYVCYFSNKKSRSLANRKFRSKSKDRLKRDYKFNNLENHINFTKLRECSNVYDSDGLKYYLLFSKVKNKKLKENFNILQRK